MNTICVKSTFRDIFTVFCGFLLCMQIFDLLMIIWWLHIMPLAFPQRFKISPFTAFWIAKPIFIIFKRFRWICKTWLMSVKFSPGRVDELPKFLRIFWITGLLIKVKTRFFPLIYPTVSLSKRFIILKNILWNFERRSLKKRRCSVFKRP